MTKLGTDQHEWCFDWSLLFHALHGNFYNNLVQALLCNIGGRGARRPKEGSKSGGGGDLVAVSAMHQCQIYYSWLCSKIYRVILGSTSVTRCCCCCCCCCCCWKVKKKFSREFSIQHWFCFAAFSFNFSSKKMFRPKMDWMSLMLRLSSDFLVFLFPRQWHSGGTLGCGSKWPRFKSHCV